MITKKPRVSIGMPVFNGEKYIAEAIDSIFAQTYQDFELIISDNASTDRTPEICTRLAARDSRISYHRQTRNLGVNANFNCVVAYAAGDYFKWAAHDDLLEPNYLEQCVRILDAKPHAVLAQSMTRKIDASGTSLFIEDGGLALLGADRPSDRFFTMTSKPRGWWEVFGVIRRDALAQTKLMGPYPFSDAALCVDLALLGPFAFVPEPLFLNRVHDDRFTSVYAATPDHKSVWEWWCGNEGQRPRLKFAERCPQRRLQLEYLRLIRQRVAEPGERARTYISFIRQLMLTRTGFRLFVEATDAVHPGILGGGRHLKRWLKNRKSLPDTRKSAGTLM